MRLDEFRRRVAFLICRTKRLAEMDEEMRLHVELRARALEEQGSAAIPAAMAAQRQFGNRTSFKEAAWDVWSFAGFENAWRDLKFGARVLRASPGFTIVAILTLALGIGATTAMFSVIDNVLLEPFPYADQKRIFSVVIHDLSSNEAGDRTVFPAVEFLDYKEQSRVFDDVMGVTANRALWTAGGAPESVSAPLVTANTFPFLGVAPRLGRYATPSDVQPGATPVCVMSYGFWKGRFAGDADVIDKVLTLDGTPRTVIGVMPPRFGLWSADVWIPVKLIRGQAGLQPPWFYLLGRLRKGIPVKTADHEIQLLAERLAPLYRPNLYTDKFQVNLQSFVDASTEGVGRTLYTLLAAVGLLLLIACGNVASLLLARVNTRAREFAIRASLGAGWLRVTRQLFFESGLLAFLGGVTGCAIAWAGLKLLITVLPHDIFPDEAVISLNVRVLAAAVAVAVTTAIFFGLVPVLGGLRRDLNESLKSGGREHSGFRRTQIRNLLIVCEVAVSLVLLAGAGVLMRSFLHEREVHLGFNPQRLLMAEIYLTKAKRTVAQQARFRGGLTTALQGLPGVFGVTTTSDAVPFAGASTEFATLNNAHSGQAEGQFALIDSRLFGVLGVRLVHGRNLSEVDVVQKRMVAVVNQALADKFFRGEDPVGKRIQIITLAHLPEPVPNPWVEIVGVTSNFKNRGVRQPIIPEAFIPYTVSGFGGFSLIVRTMGDPRAVAKRVEGAALTLDSIAMVRHARSMQEALEEEEYAKPRFGLEIFSVFAALGLVLVSAGLYGIMSYTVSQQRREMGIRLALGATSRDVQALVIGKGMRFVAAGILAGLLLSFVLLRLIANQVWGISTHDPATLISVAGIFVVVGIVACYAPSVAATHVDPAETLRSE